MLDRRVRRTGGVDPGAVERAAAGAAGRGDGRVSTAADRVDGAGRGRRSAARRTRSTACSRTSPSSAGGSTPGSIPPGASRRTDDELTLPAGLLLVATLHREPVGCGGLKLHGAEPAEIKRMWVVAGGARPRARPPAADRTRARGDRPRCPRRTAGNQPQPDRGDRPVPRRRLPGGRRPSTPSPTPTTGSRNPFCPSESGVRRGGRGSPRPARRRTTGSRCRRWWRCPGGAPRGRRSPASCRACCGPGRRTWSPPWDFGCEDVDPAVAEVADQERAGRLTPRGRSERQTPRSVQRAARGDAGDEPCRPRCTRRRSRGRGRRSRHRSSGRPWRRRRRSGR